MTEQVADLITDDATDAPEADATTTPPADAPAEGATEKPADLLSDDESGGSEGVPETYTFEPPEGVELDDDTLGKIEAFGETAREMGLSQQQYQSLIEFDINRMQQINEEAVNGWHQRVAGWTEQAKADKDIGGEKFSASVETAKKITKQFGDPQLLAMLRSPSPENPDGLSLGNHPAMLRFLNRVGKAIGEPDLLQGDAAPQTEGTLRRMYPSMFDKSA